VSEELARNREQMQNFERAHQEEGRPAPARDRRQGERAPRRGLQRTNETFVSVMTACRPIDDAQKKIETLTTNVVSLQNLLGKQELARGAGRAPARGHREVQCFPREPTSSRHLPDGEEPARRLRVKLPEPSGMIAIDSKFPLENYERMISDGPDKVTPGVFKADVRRHIDDIASKYIIPGETGDGAVMFVPAESVFAEIHARHRDLVEYAGQRHVWIVSPTTLMAVLNTARVVLKDGDAQADPHHQGRTGQARPRVRPLRRAHEEARRAHRLAHEDAGQVQISGRKISEKFAAIERAELPGAVEPPAVPDGSPPQLSVVPKRTRRPGKRTRTLSPIPRSRPPGRCRRHARARCRERWTVPSPTPGWLLDASGGTARSTLPAASATPSPLSSTSMAGASPAPTSGR